MLRLVIVFAAVLSLLEVVHSGTVQVTKDLRNGYLAQAPVWNPSEEAYISTKDLFNGPANPYGFKTHQTLTCDFVPTTPENPIGGTTPKFRCEFRLKNGEKKIFKVKYDQQHNPLIKWGRGNEEVYASVISQRVLWALGFGSDQAVPVSINCRNCPIEPWTYTQVMQGYDSEDVASGWMDMRLVKSGEWNRTVPLLSLPSAIVYLKLDEFVQGDEIDYIDAKGEIQSGFAWKELFTFPHQEYVQTTARNALSVLAAFISHVDNFDGNQGFICLNYPLEESSAAVESGKKSACKGQPFAYIHDVGGTLGYGWKITHKNFWPNYMDLQQWLEASVWGDISSCEVTVNAIPGCSWHGKLVVSEDGRALAARLISQLTDAQILDLFTAARADLMRGDTVNDWVAGFKSKRDRDLIQTVCGK